MFLTLLAMCLLSALAGALVVGLFLSQRQRQGRANTDFLTGAANRGRAFEAGEKMCERAITCKEPLAVVLLDIDRFRKVNNTLGHAAGDQALQQTVEVVQGVIAPGALLARVGGEEFVVILPNVDRELALETAEKIRSGVASSGFLYADRHPVNVTVSLGVAMLQDNVDFQSLVNQADKALYVAKNSGRNRVVMASSTADVLSQGQATVGSRQRER